MFLALPTLALFAYALHRLCRRGPRRAAALVGLLVATFLLVNLLPDLLLGGQRSLRARYFFPAFLGLQLALANLLTGQSGRPRGARDRLRKAAAAAILLCGLASSLLMLRAPTWWGLSEVDRDLVAILNGSPEALLVSDQPFGVVAMLTYGVDPRVRFLLFRSPQALEIPEGYDPVYLYQPSRALRDELAGRPGLRLELVYRKPRWERTSYSLYSVEQSAQ
jgi:hypothetical protein